MKKFRQMLPRTVILVSVVALIIYCIILFSNAIPSNTVPLKERKLITNSSFIEDNRFIKNTAIPVGNGSWLYDEVLLEQD